MNSDSAGSAAERRVIWREAEWIIAIFAVIASVGALILGSYTAMLQRRHDSASVWPHLELGITYTAQTAGMQVSNSGIGPAIVKSVFVSVDGRAVRSWPEVFKPRISRRGLHEWLSKSVTRLCTTSAGLWRMRAPANTPCGVRSKNARVPAIPPTIF